MTLLAVVTCIECCKTVITAAAGIAVFISETIGAQQTIPAGAVFSAVKFKTVTAFNAMILVFQSAIAALMADIAKVVIAITAFSASALAFLVKIIAATAAIGAMGTVFYLTVNAKIPAFGAHFGAVFAKVAIGAMHKTFALEAFAAFTAMETFFKHGTVDTETAANFADFGTI